LQAGQKVVVSGQFLVDSEANLKASTTRMSDMSAPAAAQPSGPATHRGEGKVEKIAKDEVTISHGPIESMQWGPMTMGFKLPASGLPPGVGVGDPITFEFRQASGGFEITSIARTGGSKAAPTDNAPKGALGTPKINPSPGAKP